MNNRKVSTATIIRTICLALALVNQILSSTGHSVIPITNEEIEQLVSTGLTVAAAVASWWNNNSFTQEAIAADDFLYRLQEENKK
nr:MAG TPA_asm: holin [Caudoviricetes sp.]